MFGVWSLVSSLNSGTAKSNQRFSMVDYHKFLTVIQWRRKNNRTKLKVETLLTDRYTLSRVARRAPRATRAMKVKPLCPSGTPRSRIGRARVLRGMRSRITVCPGVVLVASLLIRERDSVRSCREPGIKCASVVGRGSVWPCPWTSALNSTTFKSIFSLVDRTHLIGA